MTIAWKLACAGLVALCVVRPTFAQGWQPDQPRTVQWYATHPAERERTRRACLNDPGHLERTPDCVNAKRGELEASVHLLRLRDNRRRPTTWRSHRPRRRAALSQRGDVTGR